MPAHRRPLKDKVRRQDAHSIRGGKNISAIISAKKTLLKKGDDKSFGGLEYHTTDNLNDHRVFYE